MNKFAGLTELIRLSHRHRMPVIYSTVFYFLFNATLVIKSTSIVSCASHPFDLIKILVWITI